MSGPAILHVTGLRVSCGASGMRWSRTIASMVSISIRVTWRSGRGVFE